METSIKAIRTITHLRIKKRNIILNTKFWHKVENNRFGIIPMLLVLIGCIGGLAAAFGAHDNIFKLGLVAFPTIVAASLVIGLAPMKAVLYVSAIAIVIDIAVLVL